MKKMLSLILVVTICLLLVAAGKPEANYETVGIRFSSSGSGSATRKMGDANGDGKLNYSDAMLVLRVSVGLATIETDAMLYVDVDGNGKLNYNDAMKILRVSVGLEELEPPTTEPSIPDSSREDETERD